mgnify:CR=1 FL=1
MPLSQYDKHFGGKGGAAKAHAAMVSQYGQEKGEEVFYGKMNKMKKKHRQRHTLLRGT